MVRVAVIGAGAWGIQHVRTFARMRDAELVLVCDPDEAALARAREVASGVQLKKDLADALAAPNIDAVVLATPAVLHAEQTIASLRAGKHVLVEKPLALSLDDAHEVATVAKQAEAICMVGHLMLYHPVVRRLRELIQAGTLGQIHYLHSQRVNLGRLRHDENALWSLGPHDVSMILCLMGEVPHAVSACGGSYLQPGIEDVVFLTLRFPSGVVAQIHLSWLDPRKERRLTVVGSRQMAEFDDVHPVEKLRLYDKGYDRAPTFSDYAEYLSIRNGDIVIPRIPLAEPLELECRHFVSAIQQHHPALTEVQSALPVVQILEAAQASLDQGGKVMTLGTL